MKAERERLNGEAQAWAEKRDRLHEKIRKIRLEAKGLRNKRNELNAEIKFLKTIREEHWKKRAEAIEHLRSQRLRIKALSTPKTARSSKSLEGEIAKVEWKIQTEPHSLDEEKKLVNRVKTLEVQLQVYKQIERVRNEITDLGTEAQTLKEEIQTGTNKILELAEQSQRFHEKMIKELEEAKALKTEADEMHHKFAESKEKAKACHSRYMKILEKIKALRATIRQKEEEERSKKQANYKKRVEEEASDKLKRGKKLSFEEFKILAEQGKI